MSNHIASALVSHAGVRTRPSIEHISVSSIPVGSALEERLLWIFDQTVAESLAAADIRSRYQGTYHVDLFFLRRGGRDIGFTMASYYKVPHQGRDIFIARVAMGILNEERGARFPTGRYIAAFVAFKLRHPLHEVIVYTLPVSPIPYAATCKYWRDSYPRHDLPYSDDIRAIKQTALDYFGQTELRDGVLSLRFGPRLAPEDIDRFFERRETNPDVAYFLTANEGFLRREALILIFPVNLKNILGIVAGRLGLLRRRPARLAERS